MVLGNFDHEDNLTKDRMIFTAGPKSQFYDQIWIRDACLSIINIIAKKYPREALNTLDEIFKYQKEDGTLPVRIEGIRLWVCYVPFLRNLKFILSRKKPKALYANRVYSPIPRDTIPMAILASSEMFYFLHEDDNFLLSRWNQMVKAIEKEESFEKNGLISGIRYQDWVDSINRKGKLANVNILFYQALKAMAKMANDLGKINESNDYLQKAHDYRERIMRKFWEKEGHFRAGDKDGRFDTFANIIGSLFVATPEQAVKIQDNLKEKRIYHNGLLKNFDQLYPEDYISRVIRIGNMEGYHNLYSWPWITCLNIVAKLEIVRKHQDEKIKDRFKKEALEDFIQISKILNNDGGVYEILDNITERPVNRWFDLWLFKISSYKSSPDFLNSATAYLKAMEELAQLNLIKISKD